MTYTVDEKVGVGDTYTLQYVFAGYTNDDNTCIFKVTKTISNSLVGKNVSVYADSSPYYVYVDLGSRTGVTTIPDSCDGNVSVDKYQIKNSYGNVTSTALVGQADLGANNLAVYQVETQEVTMTLTSYTLTKSVAHNLTQIDKGLGWKYDSTVDSSLHGIEVLGETSEYLFIHVSVHVEGTGVYLYVSNDGTYRPLYGTDSGNQQTAYPVNHITVPTYEYNLGYSNGDAITLTVYYHSTEKAPLIVLHISIDGKISNIMKETTNYPD